MSELNEGLSAVQAKLPKVINPATHGIIDYAHAAFFLTVGFCSLRSNKRGGIAALATGGFVLVQSLLTDYRYGVKPVLSFETHGKMDAGFASGSWLIPRVFGFEGTVVAKIFEGNALVEGTVVGLTDWNNERARSERKTA